MLDQPLLAVTSVVDLIGMSLSLWLGFYVVTRSPRRMLSWLATATLWALSGSFVDSLTHFHGPVERGALPWWWGWSVAIAVPFWFHLTVSLRSASLGRRYRALVVAVYFLALNFVAMQAYSPWLFPSEATQSSLLYSSQRPGPLYPAYGIFLVLVPALALYNLSQLWRQAESLAVRRRTATLFWATLVALLSAVYAALSIWLGLDTPTAINSLGLTAAVALLGYGVARYNALIEGRTIGRDFLYTLLAIGLVVAAYVLAALVSNLVFDVPLVAFVFLIVLAIITHSLYDWARSYLDRLFYRRQYGELRANLRDLSHSDVIDQDIRGRLQEILEAFCRSLRVSRAFIALRQDETFVISASWQVDIDGQPISSDALDTGEISRMANPDGSSVLADMALIVPLQAGGERLGAIVLGRTASGVDYTEDDLELLEDCADTVASVVRIVRLQVKGVEQINTLLRDFREQDRELRGRMRDALGAQAGKRFPEGWNESEATALVEDALRHLYDYAYLGEHKLVELHTSVIHLDVDGGALVTHLDRGRALQTALITAIDKLKPPHKRPSIPTREWHQYVVLHDCYVVGELNRDVMSTLYVGEGTFNRTRRRAIRAVARALAEMEVLSQGKA